MYLPVAHCLTVIDLMCQHILHTKLYREFCKKVFQREEGSYLDHYPHLAKEGTIDKLQELFEKTQELYLKEFGEYIYGVKRRSILKKLYNRIRGLFI